MWGPCVTVAALTLAIAASGMRGADYPAHLLRALLWDRSGVSVWNNYWYGGHGTPTYSIITPPLTALIGPLPLVALSTLAATYCFPRLTTTLLPGPTTVLANHAFTAGAVVNVVVGRAPFALGFALALATLLIAGRWPRLALVTAIATPLASPVAATFLAIAVTAVAITSWWPHRQRRQVPRLARQAAGYACATLAPIGVLAVSYPSPGRFPFRGDQFLFSVVAVGVLAALYRSPTIRVACAMVAVASAALFLVPNPLGGNFQRLTQLTVVPLAIVAWPSVKRPLVPWFAVLLAAGAVWMLQPGVTAAFQWIGDESVHADYHDPLIDAVRLRNSDGSPLGRLEVPFTDNHWESYYIAPEVPFARGWERQVDLQRNEVLYDDDLGLEEYHDWLHDNAVRWIAVADVDLDEGGRPEAHVLRREGSALDIAWIELVWRNADWRLYEVLDYVPIVEPPATLLEQATDRLTIRTTEPATVTVHYQYVDTMTVSGGACLSESENGWIIVDLPARGDYDITVEPDGAFDGDEDKPYCPD